MANVNEHREAVAKIKAHNWASMQSLADTAEHQKTVVRRSPPPPNIPSWAFVAYALHPYSCEFTDQIGYRPALTFTGLCGNLAPKLGQGI